MSDEAGREGAAGEMPRLAVRFSAAFIACRTDECSRDGHHLAVRLFQEGRPSNFRPSGH